MTMTKPFQQTSQSEKINSHKFSPDSYQFYQCKNQNIYALVNTTSQQIEYVIWNTPWDQTHIFNGFEAWRIKAMWHGNKRDEIFIPDISLQREETQKKLGEIIQKHEEKIAHKKTSHAQNSNKPLNENIKNGVYEYTNSKNQIFEIGIMWGRIVRFQHSRWEITSAQKAAITKSIKNYNTKLHSSRLQPKISNDDPNIIDIKNLHDINSDEVDNKILHLFIEIWDTNNSINNKQLRSALEIYKYFSIYSNLTIREQYNFIQDNNHISLLFSGIISKITALKIDNLMSHIQRLKILKQIFQQYNNQKTHN